MGILHHVARHREDPARARPARRVVVHAALLRRLHHGARHGQRAFGGRCSEAGSAAQRPVHPEPDSHRARAARSHRALLSAVGARLGRRAADPEGRSGRCFQAGREPVALDSELAQRIESCAGQGEGRRRQRPAGNLCQRVLGTSGDAALARGQPAGVLALSAGTRVSAQGFAGRRHPRLEDAAHPDPDGRRSHERHRPRQPVGARTWTSSK